MPKEYLDCVEGMVKDGKSRKDAQKACAIRYYKKHGKTPQQAAGEFAQSLYDVLAAVSTAIQQRYGSSESFVEVVDVYPAYAVIRKPGDEGFTAVDWGVDENGDVKLGEERVVEKTYVPAGFAEGDKKPGKPKEYEDVSDDQFADPKNYKYPMNSPERCRAALHYWGMSRNREQYSPEEQKRIYARMKRLAKKHGVEVDEGGEHKMAEKLELVEREAKIFEAGVYEDKDLEVTEDELEALVGGFKEIPIKVEHVDSPLMMGSVKSIWRKGKELFGRLAFPKQAWDLLEVSGAKRLSSSIKRDKSALVEVSIVRHPRVADAAIYSADEEDGEVVGIRFEADLPAEQTKEPEAPETPEKQITNTNNKEGEFTMAEKPKEMDVAEAMRVLQAFRPSAGEAAAIMDASNAMVQYVSETEVELKATAERALAAMRELQKANAERLLEQFKRTGKVTPAAEKFAKAILLARPLTYTTADAGQVVSFTNDAGEEVKTHFAEMFCKFLEALPPVISFQEMAKQQAEDEAQFSPEEIAYLSKAFGVSKEQIMKQMNR